MLAGGTATIVIAIGTAMLALWTHVRFPSLAPESNRGTIMHVVVSVLLLHVVPIALHYGLGSAATLFVVLFGVAVPALVYVFLAAIWMILMFQGLMAGARR